MYKAEGTTCVFPIPKHSCSSNTPLKPCFLCVFVTGKSKANDAQYFLLNPKTLPVKSKLKSPVRVVLNNHRNEPKINPAKKDQAKKILLFCSPKKRGSFAHSVSPLKLNVLSQHASRIRRYCARQERGRLPTLSAKKNTKQLTPEKPTESRVTPNPDLWLECIANSTPVKAALIEGKLHWYSLRPN